MSRYIINFYPTVAPRCQKVFPLRAEKQCKRTSQSFWEDGHHACWEHRREHNDGCFSHRITYLSAETISAAEAYWMEKVGFALPEKTETTRTVIVAPQPEKPWVGLGDKVKHDPYGFIPRDIWTRRYATEEEATAHAEKVADHLKEVSRKTEEDRANREAKREAKAAAIAEIRSQYQGDYQGSPAGPVIHSDRDLLNMLNEGEGLKETTQYTLLGWSPWGHHFVIGEHPTPEPLVLACTNWLPGEDRHFYFTLLPPGQQLQGYKGDSRRISITMENRKAKINPETLEWGIISL